MAGTGLKPKHYKEPEVSVWPEHWPAIQLFLRFSNQWRMGMGGPVGLDYSVIQHELARLGVTGDEYTDLLDDLRVIESAALEEMRKE